MEKLQSNFSITSILTGLSSEAVAQEITILVIDGIGKLGVRSDEPHTDL
jgi:hypothetical protein